MKEPRLLALTELSWLASSDDRGRAKLEDGPLVEEDESAGSRLWAERVERMDKGRATTDEMDLDVLSVGWLDRLEAADELVDELAAEGARAEAGDRAAAAAGWATDDG